MAGWLVSAMVWAAGAASWAATLLSLAAAWSHCKSYSQPNLQRWVVRIIMMVPVYALTAWATLVSVESAYYLDAVRDVYEAFVIYCFVSLLIAYFGGERAFLLAMRSQAPTPLFWPASLVRRDLDFSDPYDYLFLKRGILQYVAVKPTLAVATMAMKSLGAYHEGRWAPDDGYLWVQLVYNASVSLSLYCLVVFYMATRESLAPWRPLPKFLCVKAIVFFSYWQGLAISILVGLGLIHDTPTLSADHIATFLQSWLICLEMLAGALGHWISFSYLDYVPASRLAGRLRLLHAVRDALGVKDVVIDARNAWTGHQYTYKYFDPAVPVDELDVQRPLPARQRGADAEPAAAEDLCLPAAGSIAGSSSSTGPIKERRLRAGMRYTQGGKKTYWLPAEPVDHRAVAFAAGGAGRTRAALLHGVHGAGTGIKESAKFIGSTIHASSRAMHESRRVQRHAQQQQQQKQRQQAASSSPASPSSSSSSPSSSPLLSEVPAGAATEHTYLLSRPGPAAAATAAVDCLAELSMDPDPRDAALDDALFAEARRVDGDFNYPVMEIGVAVGYARRRPYGNTIPRSRASSVSTARRPVLHPDQFPPPPPNDGGRTTPIAHDG